MQLHELPAAAQNFQNLKLYTIHENEHLWKMGWGWAGHLPACCTHGREWVSMCLTCALEENQSQILMEIETGSAGSAGLADSGIAGMPWAGVTFLGTCMPGEADGTVESWGNRLHGKILDLRSLCSHQAWADCTTCLFHFWAALGGRGVW